MNNPSPAVEAIPPVDVSFKPLLPPPTLTRWQRFGNYMKTPEAGLLPLGIMVVAAHVFAAHYIFFSEDFRNDFEDDPEAHFAVKKLVTVNKGINDKLDRIRSAFSGFKG